ncbi:hypothetical protein L6164_037367 [Bauhinia variegata]|uniref:Uncharacterized protein n=1 Tax=Bauhinia variegata TaxID=167791 RepID=A0ACB9KJW4_BAUVA|nr:hypothetical protein L6164_037367 [Bauhinia variegata]
MIVDDRDSSSQVCLKTIAKGKWYLDSICSRLMTDGKRFTKYRDAYLGLVTFGGNEKGYIIRVGNVQLSETLSINDVYLVNGLRHSLLSIS